MKYKAVILIFILFIAKSFGYDFGTCKIEDDGLIDWTAGLYRESEPIKDTDTFEKRFPFTGSLNLSLVDSSVAYLTVQIEGTELIFKTTEDFENYEQNIRAEDPEATKSISTTVTLMCDTELLSLSVIATVEDTNNHQPKFKSATYKYTMPMPLAPRIDLTSLGDPIIVEDLDFSNTDVVFTVESDNFIVDTLPGDDKRLFKAALRVKNYFTLTETTVLTVTSTDTGNPSSSDKTEITIEIDGEYSLPNIPTFSDSLYKFDYIEDSGSPTVTSSDGKEIQVTTTDPAKTTVGLDDKGQLYFTTEYDKTTNKVSFKSNGDPIPASSNSFLALQLTVTFNDNSEESSNTVILVELPSDSVIAIPQFKDAFYIATYLTDSENHTVKLDKTISVTESAEVTLEGDSHFSISQTDDQWQVNVKNLDEATLNAGGDIVLTLIASVTDETSEIYQGFATLIVRLPEVEQIAVPKFTQSYYSATYEIDSDGNAFVSISNGPISATSSDHIVDITFQDGVDKHFSIGKDDDNNWKINVDDKLSADELQLGEPYIIALKANIPDETDVDSSFSTLIISLPEPASAPKFSNPYYTATYGLDDDTKEYTVEVTNGPIEIVNAASTVEVIIETSESNSDFFTITLNEDKTGYDLKIKNQLDFKTLISNVDIVLTLKASVDGITDVGEATLVIELPKEVAPPAFTEPVYEANCDTSTGSPVITITNGPITLEGNYLAETIVSLSVSDEFQSIFQISESSPYEITATSLNDTILMENREIVLTLIASFKEKENSLTTTAAVVVALPELPTPPNFVSEVYIAEFDGDKTISMVDDTIISTDPSDASLSVTPDGPYKDNFEAKYNEEIKGYSLNIISPLDEAVVTSSHDIYVILHATVERALYTSTTTVVVRMPEKTENVVPKFSHAYYTASYDNETDKVTVPETRLITITSEQASTTEVNVIETYKDYFQAKYDGSSWNLELIGKLDENVLKEEEIYISLEATLTGSAGVGAATVIMGLPEIKRTAPTFSKPYFTETYGEDNTITNTDPIKINENVDSVEISIEGTYSANFKAEKDETEKVWLIKVENPLDIDNIKENPVFITLKAQLDNSVGFDQATLVVNLPSKEDIITFGNTYYEATYVVDDAAIDTVNVEQIIISANAEVTINNDYDGTFGIDCVDLKCHLTVLKDLNPDVLEKESEILLVLEASVDGSTEKGTATVIISLPRKEIIKAPEFTKPIYTATYTKGDDGTVTIPVDSKIQITSSTETTDVDVTLDGEHKDYFDLKHEDNYWSVITKDLPESVIEDEVSISLNLVATKKDVSVTGKAGLVVNFPKKSSINTFHFENDIYIAQYESKDGEYTISLDGDIKIEGDDMSTATLKLTGENAASFDYEYAINIVTLKVITPLPADVLEANAVILINIEASKDSEPTATTTIVIELPKTGDSSVLEFTNIAYIASYEVVTGDTEKDKVTIETGPISINGIDDVSTVNVDIQDETYKEYFALAVEDDHWIITIKNDLAIDTINTEISLLIGLTATSDSAVGEAAVVIKLPKKTTQTSFYFNRNVYMAEYDLSSSDGTATIDLLENISLVGDSEKAADLKLSGEYADSFDINRQDNIVTLTVKTPLSSEVLKTNAVISIYMEATKESETSATTIAITLPKTQDSSVLEFTEVAYTVSYLTEEGGDVVTVENGPITIKGISDSEFEGVNIEIEDTFKEHFELKLDTNQWILSTNNLPSETIDSEISLLIKLKATYKNVEGESALVIKLPKKITTTSFYFKDNVYIANYEVSKDSYNFTVEKDVLVAGDTAGVSYKLEGDYAENFKYTEPSDDGKINIEVSSTLSDDVIKRSVISFNIIASKVKEASADTEETKTVIIVKFTKASNTDDDSGNDNTSDNTGLIAAVSVLAVLLVASLVGSAVFYYLRFKRASNYNNMDEGPRISERFRKNSNETKNKIEHPTRRATGVIKYPLDDEVPGETPTDEVFMDKRKSVQFDTINVDELEIEKSEDDDNESTFDALDDDGNDERRSSRV